MSVRARRWVPAVAAALVAVAGPASAQVPDKFTNLQVLPKDIPRAQLLGMMRGFTGALGVRCNHCHVAPGPNSLDGADFASDAKEPKKVARVMMRMTQEINTRLLPQTGRSPVLEVRCVTCHRGLTRPEPLLDVLRTAAKQGGADAAITRYRELRDKHYGRGAYDFGAPTLNQLAESMAEADLAGAIAIQRFNLEANPGQAATHGALGRLYERQGDRAAARVQFERAAALDPGEDFYRRKIEELNRPPSPDPSASPRE